MRISLISAMTEQGVIGKQNQLPWHLPVDLLHFKKLTLAKPIIMGRKTFESIGKPLAKRTNIILTRDINYLVPGCIIVHSVQDALNVANSAEEVMIIGGAAIYELFLPIADMMYLTLIHQNIDGDTYFPKWEEDDWQEISSQKHLVDDKNPFTYSFVTLQRKAY